MQDFHSLHRIFNIPSQLISLIGYRKEEMVSILNVRLERRGGFHSKREVVREHNICHLAYTFIQSDL